MELPINIHERTIGFLESGEDVPTIARCALVCRAWLPFSRFKLYYVVCLDSRGQWTCFKRLLSRSTSPSIVGYLGMVRTLRIYPGSLDGIGWGKDQERPWAHLPLLYGATRLKGLTSITLSFVDLTIFPLVVLRCGRYHYDSITALELMHCVRV